MKNINGLKERSERNAVIPSRPCANDEFPKVFSVLTNFFVKNQTKMRKSDP